MNWIMIVGVAVIVVIIGALFVPSRKDKDKDKSEDRMSAAELSERQRALWARVEEAIGAHHTARGAEVGPARERMLRLADEADAEIQVLERAGASERQVLMAKLAAEEIRGFVNEGIARHPEGQQT